MTTASSKATRKRQTSPAPLSDAFLHAARNSPAAFAYYASGERFTLPQHLALLDDRLCQLARGDIKRLMVFMPPRHGKPCYNESMVLMEDGSYKQLDEIRVGDRVITHTGRARRVLAVHEQGNLPTLRISTANGRSTVAAKSHPFLTAEGWRKAEDLHVGVVLANVPTPQTVPGEARQLEAFRFAGYIVGDGNVAKTGTSFAANITCFDDQQGEDIHVCAAALSFTVRTPRPGRYQLSGGVRGWLREAGLAEKNSWTKRVPEWVFRGTPEQIGHFIGAYFACDGSVSQPGKARKDVCLEFYSVSHDLLADVQRLLLRLGIQARLQEKRSVWGNQPYASWRLAVTSQDDAARFAARIPIIGKKPRTLAAWYVQRTKFDETLLPDPITAIEDAGELPCRCLTVEDDHTFTVDDLVVHNSELCSKILFGNVVE
jgi:hypothetical protein